MPAKGSDRPRCPFLLLVAGLLVAAGPARAKDWRWYAVPNVAYDSDDGLGFGARGELAIDAPGHVPYKIAYVLHVFATLRGYHHHRFRLDRTGLGPGRKVRITLHVAWRQWLNDGYWGIGNGTTLERRYAGELADDDPARKRYRYTLLQPFTHLTLRGALGGPWSMFAAMCAKWSVIETYPGSLLEEQRPYGMDGGLGLILSAGIIYDTREPEVNPQRGLYAELSGRTSGTLPEGAGTFGGVFGCLRGYLGLSRWLVLAGRIMAEMLAGEIPFYELVHWGGAVPVTGFGGFETLRGISFGRWRAPGKAVLNVEARFRALELTLRGRPMWWQIALFADAGIVFGGEDSATAPPPEFPIHPCAGVGLRIIFWRTFVGRLDTGFGPDFITEPDGSVTQTLSWGIYIVFDHAF